MSPDASLVLSSSQELAWDSDKTYDFMFTYSSSYVEFHIRDPSSQIASGRTWKRVVSINAQDVPFLSSKHTQFSAFYPGRIGAFASADAGCELGNLLVLDTEASSAVKDYYVGPEPTPAWTLSSVLANDASGDM